MKYILKTNSDFKYITFIEFGNSGGYYVLRAPFKHVEMCVLSKGKAKQLLYLVFFRSKI